jgi:hypothetical protein
MPFPRRGALGRRAVRGRACAVGRVLITPTPRPPLSPASHRTSPTQQLPAVTFHLPKQDFPEYLPLDP